MVDDPGPATAQKLAAAIRRREVSAMEMLEVHLVQIARCDRAERAIFTWTGSS
jgi:Asp-tRNA(Asn)/Glu-tRNA(Gln) amidotransferase A subunit family amidase